MKRIHLSQAEKEGLEGKHRGLSRSAESPQQTWRLRVRLPRATRLIILVKTKRQLKRCKECLNEVLKERKLRLSRKKTRIGLIDKGFHFLGINYLETQPQDRTSSQQAHDGSVTQSNSVLNFTPMRGGEDRYINY